MPLSPGLRHTLQQDFACGVWSAATRAYLEAVMVALAPASPLWTPGLARAVQQDFARGAWTPATRRLVAALQGGDITASQQAALHRDLASGQWGPLTQTFFARLP